MFKFLSSTGLALVGGLALMASAYSHAKDVKSAEIVADPGGHHYGKYVMRMRAAKISGIISTFFTYKEGSEQAGAWWEEIDIEIFGKNNANCWQSNIIKGNGPQRTEAVHCMANGQSTGDAYHTYTLEWTPNYLAWFFDGQEVRRVNGGEFVTALGSNQDIRFNFWPANIPGWVGGFDRNQLPVYQLVNWFEYYSYNNGQFALQWRDDFNTFDTNRWSAKSHTFGENIADFTPANAVTKDGYLILAMTRAGEEGVPGNYHPPIDGIQPPVLCPDGSQPPCSVIPPIDNFPRVDIAPDAATTVEAEKFQKSFDTTVGNQGNSAFRNPTNTDIETTTDVGGGFNVGWIDNNEWLEYDINVLATDNYSADIRVASNLGGGKFNLSVDGNLVGAQQTVTNTGGWQAWKTLTTSLGSLTQGNHTLRVQISNGAFNLNSLTVKPGLIIPGIIIPGLVEAEKPVAYYDATAGNAGNALDPNTNVDIEACTDLGGGFNVGWIDTNEWLEYDVNAAATGIYNVDVRVASNIGGGMFTLMLDGVAVGAVQTVINSGGWQAWKSLSVNVGNITKGAHKLRIQAQNGGFNLNSLNFTKELSASSNSSSSSTNQTSSSMGTVIDGPNLVKNGYFDNGLTSWWNAVEWLGAHNVTVANGEVQIAISNGSNQPWHSMLGQDAINLVAGKTYRVSFSARASRSANLPMVIQLKPVPHTAYISQVAALTTNMQTFTYTFTAPVSNNDSGLQFNMGNQGALNIWIDNVMVAEVGTNSGGGVSSNSASGGDPQIIMQPAENFVAVGGIVDKGADGIVGKIDAGDWMQYSVAIPQTGVYKVEYRYAAGWDGAIVSLRNNGTIFGTLPLTQTDPHQWIAYNVIGQEVTLQAGTQPLVVYANAGGFVIDWFKLTFLHN